MRRDSYQETAIAELGRHFDAGGRRAMLNLPTGGGKTFTACEFVWERFLSKRVRVFWIAHNDTLLNQARNAMRQKDGNLRIKMVSSAFRNRATDIENSDQIVFATNRSLGDERVEKESVLSAHFASGPFFIVIDEAHRSVAGTYARIIRTAARAGENFRGLLGLSATPERSDSEDQQVLEGLFDGIRFDVGIGPLIDSGVLSKPVAERVDTHVEISPDVARGRMWNREGDSTEGVNVWLGAQEQRNETIVARYVQRCGHYGKTIIFASTIAQSDRLAEMLRAYGVRAESVHSQSRNAERVLERFRPGGDIEVLVNPKKLAEGYDVPDCQSVFLARPTRSRVLLRQCIGRALRGPRRGGSEYANIVAFQDNWGSFQSDVVDPISLAYEGDLDLATLEVWKKEHQVREAPRQGHSTINIVQDYSSAGTQTGDERRRTTEESPRSRPEAPSAREEPSHDTTSRARMRGGRRRWRAVRREPVQATTSGSSEGVSFVRILMLWGAMALVSAFVGGLLAALVRMW